MKKAFFLFFLLLPLCVIAQTRPPGPGDQRTIQQDSAQKPPITAYKIISVENDTTFVDTTLRIEDDYEFNYLRRDNFELLPFSNVGRPYNRLAYDFEEGPGDLFPLIGAGARHFNYMEVEDIFYYDVPTPFTELFFKTVLQQGQILDAFFTVNTSPNLNFSIAFKGVRSLGFYQHSLTSSGSFRATVSYNHPNGRYHLKTHFVSQNLMNEENGGLQEFALEQYIAKNEEFQDRSRLEVNFEDAQSTLFGKRFFVKQFYELAGNLDSLNIGNLAVGHILNVNDTEFRYVQDVASPLFGPSFEDIDVRDDVALEHIYNEAFVRYRKPGLGEIKASGGMRHYNYGYNTVLVLEDGETIQNRLIGNIYSLGGEYANELGGFGVFFKGKLNFAEELGGSLYGGGASYAFNDDALIAFSLRGSSKAPNFNYLLHQSDYISYNWQNNYDNVQTQEINVGFFSSQLLDLEMDLTHINNYAFFGLGSDGLVQPVQYSGQLNYLKLQAEKKIAFGTFVLDNTLLYQKVLEGKHVLNVPSFVSRNSLYYRDFWFDEALYLQTGFTLNFFTDYYMNGYDPVLAEFYVQNEQEMEGFPRLDFFFNSKIDQARIFFSLEQLGTLLTGNNHFSAPLYPYRDFVIRFGVVWNFFL